MIARDIVTEPWLFYNLLFKFNFSIIINEWHVFLQFIDVITIVGTMNLPEIPLQEVILHNKIMKNIAPVRNVEYDLNYVNDVIFPSLQKTVPQVQRMKTYADDILR